MTTKLKKVLVRVRMDEDKRRKVARSEQFVGSCVDFHSIDTDFGIIWFTYINDENLYGYSYLSRKLVATVPLYSPDLKEKCKVKRPKIVVDEDEVFSIQLAVDEKHKLIVGQLSYENEEEKEVNMFTLFKYGRDWNTKELYIELKDVRYIKGKPIQA